MVRDALRAAMVCVLLPAATELRAETGIRHRIDATVSAEPSSPLLRRSTALEGTLSVSLRLSDNSMESRYFGLLSRAFSDVVLSAKPGLLVPQTRVWEEDKCHQRRGLPKVTVLLLKGAFGESGERQNIWSVVRHIGLKVPADELTPGIKLPSGVDAVGAFSAFRAQSRDTRLNVDLKIYGFECQIAGDK